MTAELMAYMAADENRERRIQFELVAHCAPFLKGMRTASILNIEKEWIGDLYGLLKATDISCRVLAVRKERCLVLFFWRDKLYRALSRKDVRRFLKDYGYKDGKPGEDITRLSARINRYSKAEIAFPHEMGVFLDYPLEDVKAFIKNDGRRSFFTGYWKVYHDPDRARLTFLAYDKAKDSAVNEFLTGKRIRDIAKVRA